MDSTQEPARSTTTTSIPSMRVRSAPGVQLSTAQMELLDQAFADSQTIFVKREFRSGYSGALVLLVALGADRAPVVVKLSHPRELQQEFEAYQQFVRQISPQNIAHLQGEPLISANGQLGLIQYSFAGGESHLPATSLRDYYELRGGDACAAVLNRIFRAFGRYWWANNRPHLYTLGEQYDRLLPVHLQVAKAEPGGEPSTVLENGKTSTLALRTIEVGHSVRLLGFQVTKVATDGSKMTLTALPAPNEASAPLRVRMEFDKIPDPLSYAPGDVVKVLDTVVVATRQTLLRDAATSALPSFDPDTKTFTAEIGGSAARMANVALVNPLHDLWALLDYVVETKTSVIHGDLNLQNVLVDTPTGFAWIIDFGETRHGPTLLDLQRLEVQVITKLFPRIWNDAQLDLAVLVELLVSLHTDLLPPSPPHPATQEPHRVLVTIRRLARQYLIDDLNWDEYYLGLVVALVGALKYDELDSLARRLALTAAATAGGLVGRRLSMDQAPAQVPVSVASPALQPEANTLQPALPAAAVDSQLPSPIPSNRRYLGIGGGILMALLALFMIWQLWPASSPPLNPDAAPTPSATEPVTASGATIAQPQTAIPVAAASNPASATTASNSTNSESATGNLAVTGAISEELAGPATTPRESSAFTLTTTPDLAAASTPEATELPEEALITSSLPATANTGDIWVNPVDGAEYVFVPEGDFTMGTADGSEDTRPTHTVFLSDFWIMRTEVTNEQYKLCVDAGACTAPANDRWSDSAFAEHPVIAVSWQQADEYARWGGGRLPTEAEWEKAARGTDGRAYPWGEEITGTSQLNYDFSIGDTVPVGSYPEGASIYGALDMAGNVEEWVADWYAPDYYASSPEQNPTGPEEGVLRILRGGSYFSNRLSVLTTHREKALPDAHFASVGFRVALSP